MRTNFARTNRALVLAGLFQSLAIGATHANDFTVTGTGFAFCHDGTNGAVFPLAGARVQLMDSDCDGSTICDDVMGEAHVNPDGSFSVTGTGGDPGDYSWSRPDVYIRIVYNDDAGVRLTDELDRDQWFDTPEHNHDNTDGGTTVDFGAWTTGENVSSGEGTKCAVWQKAHDAFGQFVQLIGGPPPAGHYDVEYWSSIWAGTPWTNTDTTHWPIHFGTWTSLHEFGHSIRHAADGDANHFNWDVTRFRYARSHTICDANANRIGTDTHAMDLAYGFNEGWAEFWEGKTGGCPDIDPTIEGNVAFGIGTLSSAFGGKKAMVNVLLAHPGAIHSLDEFADFVAQQNAMTKQALMSLVSSAVKPPFKASKLNAFAPMAYESQAAAIEREISMLEQEPVSALQKAEATPVRPAVQPHHLPPKARPDGCGKTGCEALFHAMSMPAIVKAETELRQLEARRLRSSLSRETMFAMERREADGTLNSYLAAIRTRERAAVLNTAIQELTDAAVAIRAKAGESPAALDLIADLRTKLARIERLRGTTTPLPPGVGVMAMLPEDAPVRTTRH